MSVLFVLFLVGHSLIHASYLAPRPGDGPSSWPFDMADSWLVTNVGLDLGLVRIVGLALIAVTIIGYVAAAVSAAGILPEDLWKPTVVVASIASLGVLTIFFHPWIVLGFAIDAVLLFAVLANDWRPSPIFGR